MPRIMLVDDETCVLSSLRRCIQLMPVTTFADPLTIETFDKPQDALLRAAECEFDLVISDWRMPVMDGIEFLTELVRMQPDIARFILSGYSEYRAEVQTISRLKIFHFLSKPWDRDELCALLKLALDHREQLMASQPPSRRALKREGRLIESELQKIATEKRPTNRFAKEFKFKVKDQEELVA